MSKLKPYLEDLQGAPSGKSLRNSILKEMKLPFSFPDHLSNWKPKFIDRDGIRIFVRKGYMADSINDPDRAWDFLVSVKVYSREDLPKAMEIAEEYVKIVRKHMNQINKSDGPFHMVMKVNPTNWKIWGEHAKIMRKAKSRKVTPSSSISITGIISLKAKDQK